jgi:hypothetical protein
MFRLVDVELDLKPKLTDELIEVPRLVRQAYFLEIDKNKIERTKDVLLIKKFDVKPSKHKLNTSYSIRSCSEVPFYLDSSGRLFYFNSNAQSKPEYQFQVVLKFKLDKFQKLAVKNLTASSQSSITFDLSLPIHTSEFSLLTKSSLVGFITLSDAQVYANQFDVYRPTFSYQRPVSKKTRLVNSTESEAALVGDVLGDDTALWTCSSQTRSPR